MVLFLFGTEVNRQFMCVFRCFRTLKNGAIGAQRTAIVGHIFHGKKTHGRQFWLRSWPNIFGTSRTGLISCCAEQFRTDWCAPLRLDLSHSAGGSVLSPIGSGA